MLRGNFVLWIQVSATAANPRAAAAAETVGITHKRERMALKRKRKKKKKLFHTKLCPKKKKKYLIVKSLGGTKKKNSALFLLFQQAERTHTHLQMHPGALKSLCREPD